MSYKDGNKDGKVNWIGMQAWWERGMEIYYKDGVYHGKIYLLVWDNGQMESQKGNFIYGIERWKMDFLV